MRKTKEVEKIRQKGNNFRMIILMTGILSMAFFYLLYACNNKYTTGENKSIQGILYADCGEDSVSFLSGEWEYYPDVLLTPQKRRENKDEYERRYLSIGQYGGMDLGDGDKTPFGSGTYRLLVVFPEKEQTYGIALDEIFSAYRLYVDGELIGEMGNPDPEHFEARIQNRVFTFNAKGTVEIMIAVTDRNSPYSGIQYVPVLGSPLQVNLWRGGRIFFNILSLAFVLFVLLFAGYMFLKTRKVELGLFCLICICVTGYTGYPVLHVYFSLKPQPWYAMEMLCYYLMFPLLILLQQKLFGVSGRTGAIMAAVTAALSVCLFGTELFLGKMHTAKGLYIISRITDIMKWATALYLIGKTLCYAKQKSGGILLTGTVFYACSLAGDRIWKLYEPLVGGWFPEIGGDVLAMAMGAALWMELAGAYTFRLTYEERSRGMELRLQMQTQHYRELNKKIDEISRIRHDLRHHMRTVYAYAREKDYDRLMGYLEDYAPEGEPLKERMVYCRNMAADAVFHYYAGVLEKSETEFECSAELPEKLRIPDMELCRILGNLLENAAEAVSLRENGEGAFVKAVVKIRNQKLLIEVSNSCFNEIQRKGNRFYSTGHEGLGTGTASVMETALRYGGLADFTAEDGIFRAKVVLPLE